MFLKCCSQGWNLTSMKCWRHGINKAFSSPFEVFLSPANEEGGGPQCSLRSLSPVLFCDSEELFNFSELLSKKFNISANFLLQDQHIRKTRTLMFTSDNTDFSCKQILENLRGPESASIGSGTYYAITMIPRGIIKR